MNCKEFGKLLDAMLINPPDQGLNTTMAAHSNICGICAREYTAALAVLDIIRLSNTVAPSADLKERIMNDIAEQHEDCISTKHVRSPKGGLFKKFVWTAVAAAIVLMAVWLRRDTAGDKENIFLSAFTVLSQARAVEASLYRGKGVLHMNNRIVFPSLSDSRMAKKRWLPVASLEADGKLHSHQLNCMAILKDTYILDDHCWYDRDTGRFVRVISVKGTPVYAHAFNGTAVFFLQQGPDGKRQVVRTPISHKFWPPKNPAEFLGLGTGLTAKYAENTSGMVVSTEKVMLESDVPGYCVKLNFDPDSRKLRDTYAAVTIRERDTMLVRLDMVIKGELQYSVQQAGTGTGNPPEVAWDLSGLETDGGDGQSIIREIRVITDMVKSDVSLKDMLEKATFPTYALSEQPAWTGPRHIADIADVASPPHRMFILSYPAADKRHVVIAQAQTYNKSIGPDVKKGAMVYQASTGVKVWKIKKSGFLAKILLQSAKAMIADPPAEDCTAYVLETQKGTFPILAINGVISDIELHNLADCLVPARELKE